MAINNNKQKGDKLRADEWNELALETNNLKGKVSNPSYLNSKVFPTYDSVEEASSQITNLSQAGDTVRILQSDGSVILYWLQPDEEQHLKYVLKESGGGSSSDIIGPDGTAIEPDSKNEINYTAFTNKSAVIDETTEEVKSLGYKILEPERDDSESFIEQITEVNTIYEVRDEFDLKGADITIPTGSAFNFNGGRIVDSQYTAKILGVDKITINPRDLGCIKGKDATLADNNSKQLLKITNVETVVIELDDDYTFGSSTIPEFNNLIIHGNGHSIYGAASVIFRVKKDLAVKNLCYDTLANNPTLFSMIDDYTSNVSIDNMKIDNGIVSPIDATEMTSVRIVSSNKKCQFKTETTVKTFSTTDTYEENDYVLRSKHVYRCKNENGHTGAYEAKDFVRCTSSLYDYTEEYDATKDYTESTKFFKIIDDVKRYFYFTTDKAAGAWSADLITNNIVQEVEKTEIDRDKKVNLSVINCIFRNVWNNAGSHVIFLMQDTMFDYLEFKNNIVENMGDCFCNAGVTNSSLYTYILQLGYNYERVPRHIEFANNTFHNETTFKPWDLILNKFPTFSEETPYSKDSKVKYTSIAGVSPYTESLTKIYKFVADKEAGAWDDSKVSVTIPHTYYTPLLVEYGDCIYTYNVFTNLINYHFAYDRTYDGYLSVNDIIQENNICKNVYNLEYSQDIIKSKRGSLITNKRIYRNNVWIEEPLGNIDPSLAKYWTRTHIINDYKGYHQSVINNVFTIQNYDALSYASNYLTVFKFNNNIVNIRKLWITYNRDGGQRKYPAFTGIYPKSQKDVEIIGNTITVDENIDKTTFGSTTTNVTTYRLVPLVRANNSKNIQNLAIRDNILTNIDLIRDIYSDNGIVENNSVTADTIDNVNGIKVYTMLLMAPNCSVKFINNHYIGTPFKTPVSYGADVIAPLYNNANFDIFYTPIDADSYGFIVPYSKTPIWKCLDLEITDPDDNVCNYRFIGNDTCVYYINKSGKAIKVENDSDSVTSRKGTEANINILSKGVDLFCVSNGPRVRISFTNEAVLNKWRYHIKGNLTKAKNQGDIFQSKIGASKNRYYAHNIGDFYFDTDLEKLLYFDGECWRSNADDTILLDNPYNNDTMLTSLEDRCSLTSTNGMQFKQEKSDDTSPYDDYIGYKIIQGSYGISSANYKITSQTNPYKLLVIKVSGIKSVRFLGPKTDSFIYGYFENEPTLSSTNDGNKITNTDWRRAYSGGTRKTEYSGYVYEYIDIVPQGANYLCLFCKSYLGSVSLDTFYIYLTTELDVEFKLPVAESKTLSKDVLKWTYKGTPHIDTYASTETATSIYGVDAYIGIQVFLTDLSQIGIWNGAAWNNIDGNEIVKVATPVFTYTDNIITNITSTTSNTLIYYTIDGSIPTKNSILFEPYTYSSLEEYTEFVSNTYYMLEEDVYSVLLNKPENWEEDFDDYYERKATTIVLEDGDTIKAIATAEDMINSNIAEYTYEQE